MGMMATTLLFAYTGSSLSYMLFINRGVSGHFPTSITFFMFSEILIRMLTGATCLIMAVPVTVAVNGLVLDIAKKRGWKIGRKADAATGNQRPGQIQHHREVGYH